MIGIVTGWSINNFIPLFDGKEFGNCETFIVGDEVSKLRAKSWAPCFNCDVHSRLIEVNNVWVNRLDRVHVAIFG
jgi:hypothetical protein